MSKEKKINSQFPIQDSKFRYANLLTNAGLNEKEAAVFEALLEGGEQGAGEIIIKTGLKRGDAYNHIYSLKEKGLISDRQVRNRLKFSLEHPQKIEEFLDFKSGQLEHAQKALQASLPSITSTYNLSYHKPGVKVFEGAEGRNRMMADSLSTGENIYTFLDPEAVAKYIPKENESYVKERYRLGLVNHILASDTPFSRKRYEGKEDKITKIRLIGQKMPAFASVQQVYGNKVSYLTLKPQGMMGIIIEDGLIASMQKALFLALWERAKPLRAESR